MAIKKQSSNHVLKKNLETGKWEVLFAGNGSTMVIHESKSYQEMEIAFDYEVDYINLKEVVIPGMIHEQGLRPDFVETVLDVVERMREENVNLEMMVNALNTIYPVWSEILNRGEKIK